MREKTDSKKTSKKKEEMKPEVIIQHMGNDISVENLSVEKTVDKIVEMYVAERNYKASIKSLQVYIKPEENAAYYVINQRKNGKITYSKIKKIAMQKNLNQHVIENFLQWF